MTLTPTYQYYLETKRMYLYMLQCLAKLNHSDHKTNETNQLIALLRKTTIELKDQFAPVEQLDPALNESSQLIHETSLKMKELTDKEVEQFAKWLLKTQNQNRQAILNEFATPINVLIQRNQGYQTASENIVKRLQEQRESEKQLADDNQITNIEKQIHDLYKDLQNFYQNQKDEIAKQNNHLQLTKSVEQAQLARLTYLQQQKLNLFDTFTQLLDDCNALANRVHLLPIEQINEKQLNEEWEQITQEVDEMLPTLTTEEPVMKETIVETTTEPIVEKKSSFFKRLFGTKK